MTEIELIKLYSENIKRLRLSKKLTQERLAELRNSLPEYNVLGISVFNGWGLEEVKKAFIALADEMQKNKAFEKEAAGQHPQNDNFMQADLDDSLYDEKYGKSTESFGATVSLSRKRKPKK